MSMMLLGATAFAFACLAGFFARFYARSRDRLFIMFAGAFAILAVNRVLLGLLDRAEEHTYLFMVRLAAFALIAWAVLQKNRSERT
jgi:hypothetical protein